MKSFRNITLLISLSLYTILALSQQENKLFEIKKGEVLDILFINTKSNTDSLRKQYFATASPVAVKYGYVPLGAVAAKETPIQGNYHPELLAIGKWPSKKDRAVALKGLENEIKGFHQMRREIWSNFKVTYYEMKKDVKIELAPNRYYVVTNLWQRGDTKEFTKYLRSIESKMKAAGGDYILELTNGEAPFGYRFTPDHLSITSWKDKTTFDKFLKSTQVMDTSELQHINQFRIE